MSGQLAGATTLERRASDVVFRVNTANLNAALWNSSGAGAAEWRGTETIPAANLQWRKFLGGVAWQNAAANPPT